MHGIAYHFSHSAQQCLLIDTQINWPNDAIMTHSSVYQIHLDGTWGRFVIWYAIHTERTRWAFKCSRPYTLNKHHIHSFINPFILTRSLTHWTGHTHRQLFISIFCVCSAGVRSNIHSMSNSLGSAVFGNRASKKKNTMKNVPSIPS